MTPHVLSMAGHANARPLLSSQNDNHPDAFATLMLFHLRVMGKEGYLAAILGRQRLWHCHVNVRTVPAYFYGHTLLQWREVPFGNAMSAEALANCCLMLAEYLHPGFHPMRHRSRILPVWPDLHDVHLTLNLQTLVGGRTLHVIDAIRARP